MAAPKGNTNAETWSLEDAKKAFELVMVTLKKTTTYKVHGKNVDGYLCHYLGEACDEVDYSIDQLKYIKNKYGLNSEYQRAKRKSERNCFTDTKKGIINTAAGIINLKSNHGWTDRVDNTTKDKEVSTTTIINLGEGKKPDEPTS